MCIRDRIHREGSSDEERSKKLSIAVIMRSGLEEYFKGVLLSRRLRGEVCKVAAREGCVSALKWARDHGLWEKDQGLARYTPLSNWLTGNRRCPWDSSICRYAAAGGHLDCLIWAREHGCPWDSWTCSSAAARGHLDCLIWAREHGCPWDASTCISAAGGGHLDCLIWAREHGCDFNLSLIHI